MKRSLVKKVPVQRKLAVRVLRPEVVAQAPELADVVMRVVSPASPRDATPPTPEQQSRVWWPRVDGGTT